MINTQNTQRTQLNSRKTNTSIKIWAVDLNKRRNTNGQQVHDKMINITNHQRNAHQDHKLDLLLSQRLKEIKC